MQRLVVEHAPLGHKCLSAGGAGKGVTGHTTFVTIQTILVREVLVAVHTVSLLICSMVVFVRLKAALE